MTKNTDFIDIDISHFRSFDYSQVKNLFYRLKAIKKNLVLLYVGLLLNFYIISALFPAYDMLGNKSKKKIA